MAVPTLTKLDSVNRIAVAGLPSDVVERVTTYAQAARLPVKVSQLDSDVGSREAMEGIVRGGKYQRVLWAREEGNARALFMSEATTTQQLVQRPPEEAPSVAVVALANEFSPEGAQVSRQLVDQIVQPLAANVEPGAEESEKDPGVIIVIADWYSVMGYQDGAQHYLELARQQYEHALKQNVDNDGALLQRVDIHIRLAELLRRKSQWMPDVSVNEGAERHLVAARSLLTKAERADDNKPSAAKLNAARAKEATTRGRLFWMIGSRSIGGGEFAAAQGAYAEALALYKDSRPGKARAIGNIGLIEYEQGLRAIDDEYLLSAAKRYGEAYGLFVQLEPRHHDAEGSALQAIGLVNGELARRKLLSGDTVAATDYANKAIAAYVDAAKVRSGLQYAKTLMNYSITVIELARWNNDVDQIDAAISFLQEAKSYYQSDAHPEEFGKVEHYLGVALTLKAVVTQNDEPARHALARFSEALQRRDKGREPFLWVESKLERGYALFTIGVVKDDVTAMCGALLDDDEVLAEIRVALPTPAEQQQSSLFVDAKRRRDAVVKYLGGEQQSAATCRR